MCLHQCLMLQLANLYLVPFIPLLRAYLEVNCKQKQQDLRKWKSGAVLQYHGRLLILHYSLKKWKKGNKWPTSHMARAKCHVGPLLASPPHWHHWEVIPEATEQRLEQQHVLRVACFRQLPLHVGLQSFLYGLPTSWFLSFSSSLKLAR